MRSTPVRESIGEVADGRGAGWHGVAKSFHNVRSHTVTTGVLEESLHTDGLVGEMAVLPNSDLVVARIDQPTLFSRKHCLEEWELQTASLKRQFCDERRNVIGVVSVSQSPERIVGLASKTLRTSEGRVEQLATGIDVWDAKSGVRVAESNGLGQFVSSLKISANGEWILADQTLMRLRAEPPGSPAFRHRSNMP